MSELISNSWLNSCRDLIFASTESYIVPIAGRVDERNRLRSSVLDRSLNVVRLWAPLGSGKTFLLNNFFGDIVRRDLPEFDPQQDRIRLRANDAALRDGLAIDFDPSRTRFRDIVIIEEFDRKVGFDHLRAVAEHARDWLASDSRNKPLLILTGDSFITHPLFDELFADFSGRVMTLEPLTKSLLVEALARRIDQRRGETVHEPTAIAVDAAECMLADDRVRDGLIPRTEPPVGTFRDALSTLKALCKGLPVSPNRIEFPVSALKGIDIPTPEARLTRELLGALVSLIIDARESMLHPLSENDLVSLVAASEVRPVGDAEEYADTEYYSEEAIAPLARGGFLMPLGVPYMTGDNPVAGPFLPSPTTVRLALQ